MVSHTKVVRIMFSLKIDSNKRHTRIQELNSVSTCITLLDSRPRTDTRVPLLFTTVCCNLTTNRHKCTFHVVFKPRRMSWTGWPDTVTGTHFLERKRLLSRRGYLWYRGLLAVLVLCLSSIPVPTLLSSPHPFPGIPHDTARKVNTSHSLGGSGEWVT